MINAISELWNCYGLRNGRGSCSHDTDDLRGRAGRKTNSALCALMRKCRLPLECIGDNALNQYLLWVGSGWAGDRKDGILPGGSDVEVLL